MKLAQRYILCSKCYKVYVTCIDTYTILLHYYILLLYYYMMYYYIVL